MGNLYIFRYLLSLISVISCLQPFIHSVIERSLLLVIGYCNDETNNADCNYDGGDCCLSSPNTDLCSECVCSTTGVITSPGYPGNYANNLDVSWHIQVPSGQLIEINFISFDVE